MSWRVLDLSEQPEGAPVPQLLIKPVFTPDSYIVHLTCLSNIWSEQLHLPAIVDRAALQQSPIEVSKHDTTQLAILLDNVEKSLHNADNATCRLTRDDTDGVILHTTITLPAPLDSLTWTFNLTKRSSVTLKNELILPLLISSHIQTEQINDLIITISGKDRAITRLADQFESSNLDLASAFPSIGAQKSGRRTIKREQAARHVIALRPFQEDTWREETSRLNDTDVTTLGLFQEALMQCTTPQVPARLMSEDGGDMWWNKIPSQFGSSKIASRRVAKTPAPASTVAPAKTAVDTIEDETEDEFEVHEHFKTRGLLQRTMTVGEESTDEDDLDAVPKGQSQNKDRNQPHSRLHTRAVTPQASYPLNPISSPPTARPKGRAFRIGGNTKRQTPASSPPPNDAISVPDTQGEAASQTIMPVSSQAAPDANKQPKKQRFKIGGKAKAGADDGALQSTIAASSTTTHFQPAESPALASSPPPLPVKEEPQSQAEQLPEETPEERAERKRAELKRRMEEAAKKQAQSKKKKRF